MTDLLVKKIAVVWKNSRPAGQVKITNGRLRRLSVAPERGRVSGNKYQFSKTGPCRLVVELTETMTDPGARATRVTVNSQQDPFTFFLRDVGRDCPIFIPEYGVMVTEGKDQRDFAAIAKAIRARKLVSQLAAIENAPEESYAAACDENRELVCPTWLGLSRDLRIFEVNYDQPMGYWGYIQPRYHSTTQRVPETQDKPYALNFAIGPGASCRSQITRRLEDGILPILRSTQAEDDIHYELTLFATLETRPLTEKNLRGSDWQACYAHTGGNMLKAEDKDKIKDLLDREMRQREEETICWIRIEACNRGRVPRYAWFKGLTVRVEGSWALRPDDVYDGKTGFSSFASGRVFGIHRLNNGPAPDQELAVLVPPQQRVVYDILIPHQPIPLERAEKLVQQDFSKHLAACRRFWQAKLRQAAIVSIPESAVNERVKAGLLHCDLVALGQEPNGSVLATIGWYAPIGSESSPIIQFFDSMGWHSLAERSLNFFLDRQRDDGFIQNFGGYQLETGPALWTMGEHYRYTQDQTWVKRIQPKLLLACDYLLAWRERNKREELRGKGYGLLDGKVADPEDFFHSFMLNGLSYLGILRVSEMLAEIAPAQSQRLATEAREFRHDIRTAYFEAIGRSPVIPLSDGTWVPTVPSWTEYPGALSLYADGGNWFTHGAFGSRDSLIGSLYLVISEVLDAREAGTDILLKSHQQLFTVKNAGLSQPYYCRHDHIHLLRGEVQAFLKTYYNQFSALQDRETYTFWEHYFHASQHKTHEEGWFLMQTRWMLYLEQGTTLKLLSGIPRAWLENGKVIELSNVASYFGPISLRVESKVKKGSITAEIKCPAGRQPRCGTIRVPHPCGKKAKKVQGGIYDPLTEEVKIEPFNGKAQIVVTF
jgi:hypothetical protein